MEMMQHVAEDNVKYAQVATAERSNLIVRNCLCGSCQRLALVLYLRKRSNTSSLPTLIDMVNTL
jgi:hypothetical protein